MVRPLRRLRAMRRALSLIESDGCERTTNRGTYCWTRRDWSPTARYTADKWCDSCIAAAGLRGELAHLQETQQ